MGCGVLYIKSSWRSEHVDYGQVFSIKNVLCILCIGSGCCILLTFLLSLLTAVFPQAFQNYTKLMSNFESGNMILTLGYAVLIGPVSEEMIFRGAIFDRVYTAFPFWKSCDLPAVKQTYAQTIRRTFSVKARQHWPSALPLALSAHDILTSARGARQLP